MGWQIDSMQCKPVDGSYSNVVVSAFWRYTASDKSKSVDVSGQCVFFPPSGTFTPYNNLTQDQVLGWCWDKGLNKDAVEANARNQLNNLINPPVVQPPLPWK